MITKISLWKRRRGQEHLTLWAMLEVNVTMFVEGFGGGSRIFGDRGTPKAWCHISKTTKLNREVNRNMRFVCTVIRII